MRKGVVFVLAVFMFSLSVSAIESYPSDERFGTAADCAGFIPIFPINGTNGNEYFYCLKSESYSSSTEFLIDSYLAFGVEACLSGYEESAVPFEVYKSGTDRTNGVTSMVTLCKKRQSRSTEVEVRDLDYTPFSDSACSGVRDSFIDGSGDIIYHCQHWDPGVVPHGDGICEDTDGADIKTISEIEFQYGVVLSNDAYGFDPPIKGLTFPEGDIVSGFGFGENSVDVKKDYCVSRYKLKEYYCDVSTKTAVGVEINCPGGGECDNGKCLNPGVPRGVQDDVESCEDIDWGSGNRTIPAYIDFFDSVGAGYRYYDVCDDGGNGLYEYFCKDGSGGGDLKARFKGEESVNCVCSGGTCTGGAVSCADAGNCLEGASCSSNNDCRPGLFCLNGKCARELNVEYVCTDTDSDYGASEESIFVAGSAEKSGVRIYDRCVDTHLWEAACYGSESTEPQDLILRYVFKRCPDGGDCVDSGNGGHCIFPDIEEVCERLTFNVNAGMSGDNVCEEKYKEGAWCDDNSPPEVTGGNVGCAGPSQGEFGCGNEAQQDLRASIRCCWEQDYNDADLRLRQGDEVIERGSGGGAIPDVMGMLVGLLPSILPIILGFLM